MNYRQQLQEENSKLQKEVDVLESEIKDYKRNASNISVVGMDFTSFKPNNNTIYSSEYVVNGHKHSIYTHEVNVCDRISTLEKEMEDLKKIIKPKSLFESIKRFFK